MNRFEVGQKVWYYGNWGNAAPVATTITGVGEKNDQVVYDNDLDHWGYESQYSPREDN